MHPGNVRGQPSHIEEYAPIAQAIGQFVAAKNGNQDGDPKKTVSIMIDVVKREGVAEGKETPARLSLAPDMLGVMRKKFTDTLKIVMNGRRLLLVLTMTHRQAGLEMDLLFWSCLENLLLQKELLAQDVLPNCSFHMIFALYRR